MFTKMQASLGRYSQTRYRNGLVARHPVVMAPNTNGPVVIGSEDADTECRTDAENQECHGNDQCFHEA